MRFHKSQRLPARLSVCYLILAALFLCLSGVSYSIAATVEEPFEQLSWNGSSIDISWYSETETALVISTPAQLAGLAAIVNGTAPGIDQDDFTGKTITLDGNIPLDNTNDKYISASGRFGTASYAMVTTWYAINDDANIWTPIGSGVASDNSSFSAASYFRGVFDGAGHTVSGLYTNLDATVQGLFGCVGQGATIKNLTVEGCVSGKFMVGGIAAYLEGGSVINCINQAVVYADGGQKADSGLENGVSRSGAAGGIVGSMAGTAEYPAAINACLNYGPVTCSNTNYGGRVGGILGIVDKAGNYGSISYCANFAPVDGYQYAGGVAGLIYSPYVPITDCANTALVSGHSSGQCNIGGIVATTQSSITNCYNTGNYRSSIDGSAGDKASNVGGIAGNNGTSGTGSITNCYVTGTFVVGGNTKHNSSATVGIICGVTQKKGDLVNCYYLDSAIQPSGSNKNDLNLGYLTESQARTAEQMQESAFVTELNDSKDVFSLDTNLINDGYPVLNWLAALTAPSESNVWDGISTDTAWRSAPGPYSLTTAAQLAGLAVLVKEGDDFTGQAITLANDIDLANYAWMPIGSAAITLLNSGESARLEGQGHLIFNGIFSGQGHEITGLKITEGNGIALFGYLGANGQIKDLTVTGNVQGNHWVSGIAAICSGTMSEVTNRVTVNATGNYVGGLVAEGIGSIIINACHNQALISNESDTRSSGRVGGVIGLVDTGSSALITACSNVAQITGYQYVGGIIGGQFGEVDITCCYNSGNLTGVSFGKVYLGGIAGKCQGGTISYCYNTGDLYNQHWSAGHIRAIGGIAGCEENHPTGLAISNCYTTGAISMYTDNMIYGVNWIYMLGNISGGNSSSGLNTMSYLNCYYLEQRIAQADPSHSDYRLWSDAYKANPLIWDTNQITAKSKGDLQDPAFLQAFTTPGYFVEDGNSLNNGYPILYWQDNQSAPNPNVYSIETNVLGDDKASINLSSDTASAGTTISIEMVGLSSDRQVRNLTVTDIAGRKITVTTVTANQIYTFTMPSSQVYIKVLIENLTQGVNAYRLHLPEELDPIWTIDADSAYKKDDSITEGASVFISVNKDPEARMTSLKEITVIDSQNEIIPITTLDYQTDSEGAGVTGFYMFTMPEGEVTITPLIDYAPLSIYSQTEAEGGAPALLATYTREDMLSLAEPETLYYSGYYSETEPFIGKGEQAVTLTALLDNVGISFTSGDILNVATQDGMNLLFSYEALYGQPRYYYPNLISGTNQAEKAAGALPLDMLLIIKGNLATAAQGDVDLLTCDTRNAYRFVFGQTVSEFNEGVPDAIYKAVDKMPKHVNNITVIKTEQTFSGDMNGDGITDIADVMLNINYALGISVLDPENTAKADLNKDGSVDIADTMLLLNMILII